jgi:SAM-dependent methyltransferase
VSAPPAGMPRGFGPRFARLTIDVVTRRQGLWRLFRRPMQRQFDRLARSWDVGRSPAHLASFEAAVETLTVSPRRILDLGTGTGKAAFVLARRFPEAEVIGVDLSGGMVEQARALTPPELAPRLRFEQADASALPFDDGSFDLVALANMIPFWDELARVLAPGGTVVFGYSIGPDTPLFVPTARLRAELGPRGLSGFRELSAGRGTAVIAEKT